MLGFGERIMFLIGQLLGFVMGVLAECVKKT